MRKGRLAYFCTGSGAFFGAGAGAENMLAQLFFTPSGIILVVAVAALAVVDDATLAAAPPQVSFDGFSVDAPHAGVSSFGVSQAEDSVVGTDNSVVSVVRVPFVGAAAAPPRPLTLPRPRSLPRPRPPLPASNPPLAPRDGLVFDSSGIVDSLAFDFDLSFLLFETSPHCVIVPIQ